MKDYSLALYTSSSRRVIITIVDNDDSSIYSDLDNDLDIDRTALDFN